MTDGRWVAYVDNGREPTGLDAVRWASTLQDAGAGEILVTSIDQEGTCRGFDIALTKAVMGITTCPIIVSGGYGESGHIEQLLDHVRPSAIAVASVLHYQKASVTDIIAAMVTNSGPSLSAIA